MSQAAREPRSNLAEWQTVLLNPPAVKNQCMDDSLRPGAFLPAARQALRNLPSSVACRAPGALRRRSAIVLVGVAFLGAESLGAASAVREFEISIRDRRIEGGPSTIRVKRGETVSLRWRTDEAVSLHVHGYDIRANLSAASPSTIRFEATVAGRFPITAHEFGAGAAPGARPNTHREVTLLYLEVLPE